MGDIHGTYQALTQCLERSGFDYACDRLIVLGDVCDGYPDVKQCINELLKIKHCDYLMGNHDLWALAWATHGMKEEVWLSQGGDNTIASYGQEGLPLSHVTFLKNAHYWLEWDNRLFIHGGLDPDKPLSEQNLEMLVWDRTLINSAWQRHLVQEDFHYTPFEEIFLGHTPTQLFNSSRPLKLCNVWDLDTGAGWAGQLTIMDVQTKEYWQSDLVHSLYRNVIPRRMVVGGPSQGKR